MCIIQQLPEGLETFSQLSDFVLKQKTTNSLVKIEPKKGSTRNKFKNSYIWYQKKRNFMENNILKPHQIGSWANNYKHLANVGILTKIHFFNNIKFYFVTLLCH